MLDATFYLDGVDAKTYGIQLQKPITISEAVPIVEKQTVPGRNGDLIWETGSYKNRIAKASCFFLHTGAERGFITAGKFLFGEKGYRKLQTSDDRFHFLMARVKKGLSFDVRAHTLAPFEIEFDCKPQRFKNDSAGGYYEFESSGTIENPTGFTALPLIVIRGTGAGRLNVGGCVVNIKAITNGILSLDSETQNAYNDSGNQNMNIEAPVFPTLPLGETTISWTGGIQSVTIRPRWWDL